MKLAIVIESRGEHWYATIHDDKLKLVDLTSRKPFPAFEAVLAVLKPLSERAAR